MSRRTTRKTGGQVDKPVVEEVDDSREVFLIGLEVSAEIESIGGALVCLTRADLWDQWMAKILGARMQELAILLCIAVDNKGEGSMRWADLKKRLHGEKDDA